MQNKTCGIIGMPVETGTDIKGGLMGPDALRTAGLFERLVELGYEVEDVGNISPVPHQTNNHENSSIKCLNETIAWARDIDKAAYEACCNYDIPIFLGGDHSLSIGTVPGLARHAEDNGKQQFVLWLDAHPDFHNLASTRSGNLHGTPVAYFSGQSGFEGYYPTLSGKVKEENIAMIGLRSVDQAERVALNQSNIQIHDMRAIDEQGIVSFLSGFLKKIAAENGRLHVSLDVDFLDPAIAPAVGTTVPGGATIREAHLIMEMLYDSSLVTSLDVVELNPFLDHGGKTVSLMVDLIASLMGQQVFDRKTRPHG